MQGVMRTDADREERAMRRWAVLGLYERCAAEGLPPPGIREVARALGISESTALSHAWRLVADGYLVRVGSHGSTRGFALGLRVPPDGGWYGPAPWPEAVQGRLLEPGRVVWLYEAVEA